MSGNWCDLQPDVLSLIMKRLSPKDSVRLSLVCIQWKNAFKSIVNKLCWKTPWLLLDAVSVSAKFFCIAKRQVLQFPVVNSNYDTCIGSAFGRLIYVNDDCSVFLLQPLTGDIVRLPVLTTFPFYDVLTTLQERASEIFGGKSLGLLPSMFRYSFFGPITVSPEMTVMMISYGNAERNIDNNFLSFARAGDEAWTVLTRDRKFDNLVTHGGKFHTLTPKGMVEAWYPHGASLKPTVIAPEFYRYGTVEFTEFRKENPCFFDKSIPSPEDFCLEKLKKYLVESADGELLMLVIRGKFSFPPIFKVLFWDKRVLKWKHIVDLGDQVIFLSDRCSPICISSSAFSEIQPNSIYFAYYSVIGRFSMKDMGVRSLSIPTWHNKFMLSQVWLTPTLQRH